MEITIVIPNFNGEKLLEKNLPNILESGAEEILILDDSSRDKSLEVLEKFKLQSSKLKVIEHKKNKGFIPTVNELFEKATGDIVVLLNNDVWVEKDFLRLLPKHFENEKVFAVNLHEEGEGPAAAFWKDGFFEFERGKELDLVQKSAWASGGSAAFSKKIWKELGGFDKTFAPFYWEDTDLSFRALKMGYEILWESQSNIKHEHETTIKKTFSQRYIRWVQQRNQLLFIWKNITDKDLIKEHRKSLVRRMLSLKLGYWIPYLWALSKRIALLQTPRNDERSDLEVINYTQQPELSVIIVSYNSESFIEKCITSVLKFLPASPTGGFCNGKVIVIDNNSTDETVKVLEKYGNKIKLIKSLQNLGFSKGNNRAVKQAQGEYLFFLNPDTEIEQSVFDELIRFYENTTDAGIVAPKLIMPNGDIQASVRKMPTVWGAIKEFVFGIKNAYSQYAPVGKSPMEVEMIYGAAFLIKKDLFERLNGFDEKFFLYYEDADLCKRVRDLGKKIYYYPEVSIKHLVGATHSDSNKSKLSSESLTKYHGILGASILKILFWIPRLRRHF